MISDIFKLAFENIMGRKKRSILTILGVVIGGAAIISLISIGMGMQESVKGQLGNVGANKILITPGGVHAYSGGGPASIESGSILTDDDLEKVKNVRGVDSAFSILYRTVIAKYGNEYMYINIAGIPTNDDTRIVVDDMQGYKVEYGRRLRENDKYKVESGYGTAFDVFENDVKVGGKLEINGRDFEVVAIMEKAGNPVDDNSVFMPMESAREIADEPERVSLIIAKVLDGFEPDAVAGEIEDELKKARGISRRDDPDFNIETSERVIEHVSSVLGVIQIVLVGIAAISLIVASVGIMSSTYTSVLERTKEIGIMKSIGAKNSSILTIFLFESVIISLIGGLFGCILGIAAAMAVEFYGGTTGGSMLQASVTTELLLLGLLVSLVVGIISGLMPARAASRLHPVDALRFK